VVGGTSYFDRKEIADAAAYLRVVLNPLDEVSLRRIVNYPTRGIGRTTLLRLVESARERAEPLWETMIDPEARAALGRAPAEAVQRFVSLVTAARHSLGGVEAEVDSGTAQPGALERWVADLLRSAGLEEAIRGENRSERVAEIRVDNLRDFAASVGAYERRVWAERPLPDEEADWAPPSLTGFLERVSLVTDEDSRDEGEEGANEVTLLTLHSAKGLEFPHVFLTGLEEEILPHARSVAEVAEGAADPIAEERRLFYVGITRARHQLTLSGCRTRRRGGEELPRQPSRFLREIPHELLVVHAPDAESSLTEGDREEMKKSFFSQMKQMLG
jgi:superfamily I DNA/RNA helicase